LPTTPHTSIRAPHVREEDHLADRSLVGQQHGQPVNADTQATGGRHAVHKSQDVVLVHRMGFLVASLGTQPLLFKSLALRQRIIQLRIGVAHLQPTNENLKTLHVLGIIGQSLGQRRYVNGVILDERWLDEGRLQDLTQQLIDQFAPGGLGKANRVVFAYLNLFLIRRPA